MIVKLIEMSVMTKRSSMCMVGSSDNSLVEISLVIFIIELFVSLTH